MALASSLVTAYLVLVGLMAGSFINLAADRLPRGESIVHPRSHCRACGRQLNTIDLLPVAGYLLRRGRCATCAATIGISAPIVEAISGLCVAAPIVLLGLWPGVIAALALVAAWGLAVTALAARRFAGERSG